MEEQTSRPASASVPTAGSVAAGPPASGPQQGSTELSNAQLQQSQTQTESPVPILVQGQTNIPIVGATGLGQPQNLTMNGSTGDPSATNNLPALQSLINTEDPESGGFIDLSSISGVAGLPLDPAAFPSSTIPGLMPGFIPGLVSDFSQPVPGVFPLNGLAPLGAQALDMSTMAAANMVTNGVMRNGAAISEDEIALYDRQIRLWGMQAQQKIRQAHILLITLRSLGTEIAKNLVLAGISSITILDGGVVTPADLGAGFFLSECSDQNIIGTSRAQTALPILQRLNPRVAVHADTEDVRTKPSSYFMPFDVVIATDLDASTFNIVNMAARVYNRPFYAAGQHGMSGFIFNDLIEHQFVIEREAANVPTKTGPESRTRSVVEVQTRKDEDSGKPMEHVTKKEKYSTFFLAEDAPLSAAYQSNRRRRRLVTPLLPCLRALWEFSRLPGKTQAIASREDVAVFTRLAMEKHRALGLPAETLTPEVLRKFTQGLNCEVSPVAAMLGGQLAQDVINVLGRTRQPIQNMVVFDGDAMKASMFALHPEGELGNGIFETTSKEMEAVNAAMAAGAGAGALSMQL